jgi:hypothetical protein
LGATRWVMCGMWLEVVVETLLNAEGANAIPKHPERESHAKNAKNTK